jgi:hypothetical protein
VKSTEGQAFADAAVASNEFSGNEVIEKFNDGVNRKVKDYGYKPITGLNETGLGDIQLVAKYLIDQTDSDSYAAKGSITLPTGRSSDPDKIIDASFGDKQFKIGTGLVWDKRLFDEFKLTQAGGYTVALPSSIEKRVPSEQGSSLTKDKENVGRGFQNQFSLSTGASYGLSDLGLNFGTAWSFQYQTGITYSGSKYAAVRYDWLSEQSPDQLLHSVIGSIGFSTVEWYRRKKFVYPFEVKIVYSHPVIGRNTGTNDVIAGELVAFF